MTPDIVKQLRNRKEHRYDGPTQDYGWHDDELCHEAADTITNLRAALERANAQTEHFERHWYLRGDKLDKAREALNGLLTAPTWADQSPRDMDEEDRQAERAARAALKELGT